MWKIILTVFFVAISMSTQTHADEMSFYFAKKEIQIVSYGPDQLWVSKNCSINTQKPCLALQALPKASSKDLDLTGGKNPGATLCARIGGTVVIGQTITKNEQSFCQFPDQSMISTGAIFKSSLKNR